MRFSSESSNIDKSTATATRFRAQTLTGRLTVQLLIIALAMLLLAPNAFAAASDDLVDFYGHVPHTWDDGDPQTDDRILLRGRLLQPAGDGPFPAVVVKHGSAGMWTDPPSELEPLGDMKSQFDDWAAMLSQDGYVVLVLDSFGPRGYTTFQNKKPPEDSDVAPVYERARDAFDALDYLRGLAFVDPDRVAVLGFSHGAGGVAGAMADADAIEADMGTSFTVSTSSGPQPGTYAVPRPARPLGGQAGFNCGVSYYPGAAFFGYFGSGSDANDGYYRPYGPYLMVYGDQDSFWTVGSPQILQDKSVLAGSSDLDLSVYPGVGHSFDTSGTQEATDARAEVRAYFADCLSGAVIGDRVWADLDGDGIDDHNEPGIEGVDVELQSGNTIWQTTTGVDGSYRFDGLDAGSYTMSFTPPAGYQAVSIGDSAINSFGDVASFAMAMDQERLDLDAAYQPVGTNAEISGTIWNDDGDGLFEGGESGISGLTVTLETLSGQVLSSQPTDSNGDYSFQNLLPGFYRLRLQAEGWATTAEGGDSGLLFGSQWISSDLTLNADQHLIVDGGLVADCESYPLIAYGSLWSYELDADPPAGWTAIGYDDSGWSSGYSLLGYSSSTINTSLPTSSRVTRYFRRSFQVTDPLLVSSLKLDIERDDGAVVYLNGTEVLRSNLPSPSDSSTRAITSSWDTDDAEPSAGLLVAGTNVIAVELHQKWISDNPDWAFDLQLRAEACSPCQVKAVEIATDRDTYLKEDSPSSSKGSNSSLWIKDQNAAHRAGLLHFNLPALPPGSEVLGGDLILNVTSDTVGYYPVYAMDTAWTEADATWDDATDSTTWSSGSFSASDLTGDPMAFAHTEAGNGTYTMGLNAGGIATLANWLHGLLSHEGLAFEPSSGSSDSLAFSSKEDGSPALLRIVYRDGTCAP